MNVRSWFTGSILVLLALALLAPSALAADATGKLTLTAPNNGESWEVGTSHSITWEPYGYDPDINPSSDVVAYLEKRLPLFYLPVGKIIPSGKASIHWEGEIDEYGKYPNPGKYYLRIKNTKTGETDRSDKAITLTPRSVDLKVNRSNGPVRLKNDQLVTLSWSTLGSDFTSCSLHGVRASLSENSTQIEGLKTSGSMKGYYWPDYGSIFIVCEKSDGTTRNDTVRVKSNGAPQAEPKITIEEPNGGESVSLVTPITVGYEAESVSTVSIALYKNDKFYKWIVTDTVPGNSSKGGPFHYYWTETEQGLESAGQVFKIYVTGKTSSGKGYVDDKSDKPFRFVSQSSPSVSAPSCVLTFSPDPAKTIFIAGDEITIQWTSANANYAILPGGDKGDANGRETYELSSTKTFTYKFVGPGGETTCSKTITVDDAGQESISIVDFTATPNTIFSKQSVTLAWTTENADSCQLFQSKMSGSTSVATNGSKSVTIADTTTFKLRCKNSDLTVENSITVTKAEYNTTQPSTEPDSTDTETPIKSETEDTCQTRWYTCQLDAAVTSAIAGLKGLFGW